MSRSLYISAIEPSSGKSLVSLGLAELLARRVERPGFFRPVIRSTDQPDNDTELIRERTVRDLTIGRCMRVTHDEARELYLDDRYEEL